MGIEVKSSLMLFSFFLLRIYLVNSINFGLGIQNLNTYEISKKITD